MKHESLFFINFIIEKLIKACKMISQMLQKKRHRRLTKLLRKSINLIMNADSQAIFHNFPRNHQKQ